ncbi:helix-turn-helix domain-containing protein [Saccharopolyspora hirsuta]
MRRPTAKDDEFWRRPAVTEALRSRHFGQFLHAYRHEHRPALTQAEVGRWLHLTQAQVSRLERSASPPSDLAKLTAWATTLHVPERVLWFKLPESAPREAPCDDGVRLVQCAKSTSAKRVGRSARSDRRRFAPGHDDDISPAGQPFRWRARTGDGQRLPGRRGCARTAPVSNRCRSSGVRRRGCRAEPARRLDGLRRR